MNAGSHRLFLAIALLSILGIAVSGVSLDHHFRTTKTSYCDFGQSFNCDIVNRSEYSTVAGVPVALIGVLGYATLLLFATAYRSKAETPAILAITSFAGMGLAVYLTYIEKYVLFAWCILCLSSLATISAITLLCLLLLRQARSHSEST
jgi:uncharacterized membrane protein